MQNALKLLTPDLLVDHAQVQSLFQEVLAVHTDSMKRSILNYILRSSGERKRLHILQIPREPLSSSDMITLAGGYSITTNREWHQAKIDAESEIKLKNLTNNIVMASLTNWWHDFRGIKFVRFTGIRKFSESTGFRLSYPTFLKITEMYLLKAKCLLRGIWHRGAILIIKRFKYLKNRGNSRQ